jgi:hypothetical protein
MEKLRYNRTFKNGIITILFCMLLFGSVVAFAVVAKVQFDTLVSEMKTVEARIVDIDLDIHVKGPDEQKIYVTYEVDGETYTRELKTDTRISFAPGRGAHYSVGDAIEIFYDPEDPHVIASSRSVGVGNYYMAIALFGLGLVVFALLCMLKHSRKFLVTQDEYKKEKDEIKRSRSERKEEKRRSRAERKDRAKKKHAGARKIGKVMLIVLAAMVSAFILFLLWGAFLNALGY